MPCNLLNFHPGGKDNVKEIASINCQPAGVGEGLGVGVAERLFKAKYPATPAKTTTKTINTMFTNLFWFMIKNFSFQKIKERQILERHLCLLNVFKNFFCRIRTAGKSSFRFIRKLNAHILLKRSIPPINSQYLFYGIITRVIRIRWSCIFCTIFVKPSSVLLKPESPRSINFLDFFLRLSRAWYLRANIFFEISQLLFTIGNFIFCSPFRAKKPDNGTDNNDCYDYENNLKRLIHKKFSSPKIKIWFPPSLKLRRTGAPTRFAKASARRVFFSGFFCGFEQCGSATILT